MRFRLLGSSEVRCESGLVGITAAKQRTALALLLVNVNRPVPVEVMVTEVWGQDPPRSAVPNLRTYVTQLRARLDGIDLEHIAAPTPGYVLRAEPTDIDVFRFEDAIGRARKAVADDDHEAAETAFESGLGLWRGDPFGDVPLGPVLRDAAARLTELRTSAVEDYAEVKLAKREDAVAVDLLREVVNQNPLRERAYARLMVALYRLGDIGAALLVHRRARQVLVDELGVEPGPELAAVHQAVLRRDGDLMPAADTTRGEVPHRPHELPRNPATFVGRATESQAIRTALRTPAATSRVVVVHGPGGIGKSALALRAAYSVAAEFPDGVCYVDLQGATPGVSPLDPAEVVGRFLRALGAEVPATRAEAEARFQSVLADRRVLLVLDNAASAQQVTPLLPAGPGCGVLVTSRVVLPTLDAPSIGLGVLTRAEAVHLLELTAGTGRVAAERAQSEEIVQLCGLHPLALRIAGARLAARPDRSLARFSARLRDQRRRLDELRLDDLDVRSTFAVGYEGLTTADGGAAARLFRLLGTLDVPEVGVDLVAALAGVDARAAEDALDELVAVRLVEPVGVDRFTVHDLLRLYAAELAERSLSSADRAAALTRALDWYLETCRAVVLGDDALRWFDVESSCLVSAAVQASALRPQPSRFAVDLLVLIKPLALKRGRWHQLEVLSRLALDVAARLGDTAGQNIALATASAVHWQAGRPDDARDCVLRGLDVARAAGDLRNEARALHNLGWLAMRGGDLATAHQHIADAVDLWRDGDDDEVTSVLQHNQGEVLLRLDRGAEAVDCFHRALLARRAGGDRLGESVTLAGLARAHLLLGQGDDASAILDEAVDLSREVGNHEDELESLLCRSELRLRHGDPTAALLDLGRAADLADELEDDYGRAAVLRQTSRADIALGDHARAACHALRAEALLATPGVRLDPILERLLDRSSGDLSQTPGSGRVP